MRRVGRALFTLVVVFVMGASAAEAAVLRCAPIHWQVYDNKNKVFRELAGSDYIAVDFEAQYAWFGGNGRWMRMSGVDGTGDEIVAFVRNGTGTGYFTLHYNRESMMLTKTANWVLDESKLINLEYGVFQCSPEK